MTSKRAERTITVSGKNGYVQLLESEKKAFRIEVYFTATNVGITNYYSYEWYKERTIYGRFKVSAGEYTSRERLVQYQNELVHSEEATLFEIVKRLQCEIQRQYRVNKFLVETVGSIASSMNIAYINFSPTLAYDEIPPQPISIPGLQMDGIYYNMFPGCAGKLVFQTWYDEDICKDVNGKDLTRDNRGKPPEPASTGRPPGGDDSNVPPPTYGPGNTYKDPDPTKDEPTETLSNPIPDQGIPGTLYNLTFRDYFTVSGRTRATPTITIQGKYGAPFNRSNDPELQDFGLYTAIGAPNAPPEGIWRYLVYGGYDAPGTPTISVTIISIVPQ